MTVTVRSGILYGRDFHSSLSFSSGQAQKNKRKQKERKDLAKSVDTPALWTG
jgi:hypothetical protein